jgi:PAS domain S-box-containing protein
MSHEGLEGSLLEHVPAAVIATDLDGCITYWNPHAETLYGWSREEAMGRSMTELLVPEPALDTTSDIIDRLRAGHVWEGEFQVRRKDGSVLLCHATDAPVTAPDGSIIGMVAVSVELTERVRAARRLAARTAVTRALAEPATVEDVIGRLLRVVCETLDWDVGTLWRIDEGAGVIRCIEIWCAPTLEGVEFEALTRSLVLEPGQGLPGKVWAARAPTWVGDVAESLVFQRGRAATSMGLRAGLGFPIVLGDRALGVMEFFTTQPETPDEPLLEAMSVIGSQIGQFLERKGAERAVLRSEASRAAILQAALDCVITMDHLGHIVEFNPAAEATFHRERADVLGKPLANLIIPPELRERHWQGLARYLETGEGPILGKRLELMGMRADGSLFPVELTVVRVGESDPPLFTAYLRDITERKLAEESLRASRDQFEAIFQGVAEGITVQGPDGQIVYANDAAARTLGFSSRQELLTTPVARIMERFELWDEAGDRLPLEELPGRLALQGEPAERVVRYRNRQDGEERWAQVKATPISNEEGGVQFAVNIFHDITERHRAQENQRFLAEASAILVSSLDYDETLRGIARLAVPRLADWCTISMREADGSVRQLVVEHVNPARVHLAQELGRRYPEAPLDVHQVLRTGRSDLYPDISRELLEAAAVDEDHLVELVRSLGLRSAMIVPLVARNRILGAITFVSAESGRQFGPDDLRIAEDLAQRAALAVDNASLFRERTSVADALQKSLLPPQLPEIPRVDVAARYHAAGHGNEVGGDFYDVFPTAEGSWAVVIGDVCGKGPEAAAVTGLARHTIRAAAIQERRPSGVLATLNDAVIQQRSDHMFCTACYVRVKINPKTVRATVCCAGHPLPLLLRSDGRVQVAGAPGTLLGIFPEPQLLDRAVDLGPGDALVLYTDGVVEEQEGGHVFGRDRLVALLESCVQLDAAGIAESIERAVLSFRPGPPRDDIAILVLRIRP